MELTLTETKEARRLHLHSRRPGGGVALASTGQGPGRGGLTGKARLNSKFPLDTGKPRFRPFLTGMEVFKALVK